MENFYDFQKLKPIILAEKFFLFTHEFPVNFFSAMATSDPSFMF